MQLLIRQFYIDYLKIDHEEILDILVQHSKFKKINKRTTLFKSGDTMDGIYFYYDGFYYCSYPKSKTRKVINFISNKKGVPLIFNGNLEKQTCFFNVYVPVESLFIILDFETAKKVLGINGPCYWAHIQMLKEFFTSQTDIHTMRSLPPIQRIEFFFRKYSTCAIHMTNTEISQFLDMSRSEYLKSIKLAKI